MLLTPHPTSISNTHTSRVSGAQGLTPLSYAAATNHPVAAEHLVKQGADVQAKNLMRA
jgi:hypothetical protein